MRRTTRLQITGAGPCRKPSAPARANRLASFRGLENIPSKKIARAANILVRSGVYKGVTGIEPPAWGGSSRQESLQANEAAMFRDSSIPGRRPEGCPDNSPAQAQSLYPLRT
jgi:hypothetical protein